MTVEKGDRTGTTPAQQDLRFAAAKARRARNACTLPFVKLSRRIFRVKNALHRCMQTKDVKCTTLRKSEKMPKRRATNELRQIGIVNYFTNQPRCATHILT